MKVTLISNTDAPEAVVATAARTCYSSKPVLDIFDDIFPDQDGTTDAEYIEMLASNGHESPIEHASFTFAIEDVSRSLLAQLTRHRIASYSVRSQRYVSEKDFSYVIPPEIMGDDESLEVYGDVMAEIRFGYGKLVDRLMEIHEATGMKKRDARKKAQEDARYILPNACCTQLVVTMNARSLLNFFRQRCCNRAQWEIRELANEMLKLCKDVAPAIFANAGAACVRGKCPEGNMSCGKAEEMRAAYHA